MYNSALWSHYPFSNAEGLYVDGQRRIKPMRELKDGGEGSPSSREDLGGKWPKSQGLHSGRPEKEEQRARGYPSRRHLGVLWRMGSKEPGGGQVVALEHYASVTLSQSPR